MNIFQFCKRLNSDHELIARNFINFLVYNFNKYLLGRYEQLVFRPARLVQLNPSIVCCTETEQLVEEHILNKGCTQIERVKKAASEFVVAKFHPKNQGYEIQKDLPGLGYFQTTGTDCGKPLSYFISVVNRVLWEHAAGGLQAHVRSIVIYPLKTLLGRLH